MPILLPFFSHFLLRIFREKAHSNKIPALAKSMNMDIWAVGTSNQLFIRGSLTETKFSKHSFSHWENFVLYDRSTLYSFVLFVLTLASDEEV